MIIRSCNNTFRPITTARPLRLEFPGAIYHLTSRGNARQKVFFTAGDRELFLKGGNQGGRLSNLANLEFHIH